MTWRVTYGIGNGRRAGGGVRVMLENWSGAAMTTVS